MTEPLTASQLETQLVLRAGHLPSCGEGAEFPWDCTCDYAGFMETMGVVFAERAARQAPDTSGLREALEDLLDDTQHSDHDCGDVDCPVTRARAALEPKP